MMITIFLVLMLLVFVFVYLWGKLWTRLMSFTSLVHVDTHIQIHTYKKFYC